MAKVLVITCGLLVLILISWAAGWAIGYNDGKRDAEDFFCDKYLNDKQ